MSKMGSAVVWIQDNNLQDDPDALVKYVEHKKKQDGRNNTKPATPEWKDAGDIPNRDSESKGGQ